MRALGYRTVDLLVDTLTDADAPPLRRAAPGELRARLGGPPPEEGEPFERVLERLAGDVLPFRSRGGPPPLLPFIPFPRAPPRPPPGLFAGAPHPCSGPGAGVCGRCSPSRAPAARTSASSTRSPSSRRCAAGAVRGSTSTRPTAASPS